MLVPTISTLRTEDFPGQKEWIPRLLSPINSLLTTLSVMLNGNVTFGDNIPAQTIRMNFTYSSTSDFPKVIAWSLPSVTQQTTTLAPVELRVCSAMENGAAIAVVPAWSYANGLITISYFVKLAYSAGTVTATTLTVGSTYNIVLRGQP